MMTKTQVEECHGLRIDSLLRAVKLKRVRRWSGRVNWCDGSTIDVEVDTGVHLVQLSYARGGRAVNLPVRLLFSTPHFGGSRAWFACPSCHRRAGVLYLPPDPWSACPDDLFKCRLCHGLTYRCQAEKGTRMEQLRREVQQMMDADLAQAVARLRAQGQMI